MRVLALADEAPPVDAAELVASNQPDAVVTLGDLEPAWIASLTSIDLPRLGVHGNHDAEHELTTFGIRDLHLTRERVGGWSFAGFEGCVRYWTAPTSTHRRKRRPSPAGCRPRTCCSAIARRAG